MANCEVLYPVIDWQETENTDKANLWQESWDDDDTAEDFTAQLRWVKSKTSVDTGWG